MDKPDDFIVSGTTRSLRVGHRHPDGTVAVMETADMPTLQVDTTKPPRYRQTFKCSCGAVYDAFVTA